MTFNNAAWAIDGALMDSSLARRAQYAASGGAEGIVNVGDLKVITLATPGIGVRITSGVGLVLNRYQGSNINETYVVSNPTTHTITAGEMPPVSASARSFIVAVTVGDPEFSQVGHPWMPSTIPAGEEADFLYVRPILIQVPANSTTLNVNYPALVLARVDIPANTTTVTSGMITDLRDVANPRSRRFISHSPVGNNGNSLTGPGGDWTQYQKWPNIDALTVKVPAWATRAKISGFVEGVVLNKAGGGGARVQIVETGQATSTTNVDESAPRSGADRINFNLGGEIPINSAQRGQTVRFAVYGRPGTEASKSFLTANTSSSVLIDVTFEEVAT